MIRSTTYAGSAHARGSGRKMVEQCGLSLQTPPQSRQRPPEMRWSCVAFEVDETDAQAMMMMEGRPCRPVQNGCDGGDRVEGQVSRLVLDAS